MPNRHVHIIGILLIAFSTLLLFSFYFLYTSPSIGTTLSFDKSNGKYVIASSTKWSPLRAGDSIQSINNVPISFHHLLVDNIYIDSRQELFDWFKAKGEIYRLLSHPPVVFTVVRNDQTLSLPITPRNTGLNFLNHLELIHVVIGIVFFLLGTIVYAKQQASEPGSVFCTMCLLLTLVFLTNATSLMTEIAIYPLYMVGTNIVNIVSLLLGNALLLHLCLLLPDKRRFLRHRPYIPYLFYAVNIILAASLAIRLINICVALYSICASIAIIQASLTVKDPVQSLQIRWIGAGFIFGLSPWIIINGIPLLVFGHRLINDTFPAAFVVCIPLSMAFAIQKYRLLDIDDIFQGTLAHMVTILALGIVDFSILGLFVDNASMVSDGLEMPAILLSFVIPLTLYGFLKDRVRWLITRLSHRRNTNISLLLASFVDKAGGLPPENIIQVLAEIIRDTFRPQKLIVMKADAPGAAALFPRIPADARPVNLWESSQDLNLPDAHLFLALPICRRKETHHLLLLGALPEGGLYSHQDVEALTSLLKQAQIVYDNALLYEENAQQSAARQLEERQHQREKEKILKDLHDGIGGITSNIGLLAELAQHKQTIEETRGALSTISSLARESLMEIRNFMQSLDPVDTTWDALASEIRYLGFTRLESHAIDFQMEETCSNNNKPGSLLFLNIIRIHKEALTNIIKHSQAKTVRVCCAVQQDFFSFTIRDDGIGITKKPAPDKGRGKGLYNMQTRAEEIGGDLRISVDQGFEIRLVVPLPLKYPDQGIEF